MASEARASGWSRRADIQGLRGLAVGLVVAAHAHVPHLAGGFVGVDVFFVISGFLITTLMVRETTLTGRLDLVEFYRRRARRILPAATVTLLAVVAYSAATSAVTRLSAVIADAWWSAFFFVNVHFARIGTDYFADQRPSPLQHFWSLSVEEQFYLAWPLVMLVAARWAPPRLRRRVLGALLLVVMVGSAVWAVHLGHVDATAAYFSTPARSYELAAGGLLAVAVWGSWTAPHAGQQASSTPRIRRRRQPVVWTGSLSLLSGAGVATLAAVALVWGSDTPFPTWRAALPVAATVVMLATPRSWAARLLGLRPMRFLGDISYSLYLWHWPILVFGTAHLAGVPAPIRSTLLVAASVTVATLSYRLVEQPFHTGAVRMPQRLGALVLWPAMLALVGVSVLGGRAYADHRLDAQRAAARAWYAAHHAAAPDEAGSQGSPLAGVESELSQALKLAHAGAPIQPDLDLESHAHDIFQDEYPCYAHWRSRRTALCPQGDVDAKPLVMLVGDSHAGMWQAALDRLGVERHFRLISLIKPACDPYDVVQRTSLMPAEACTSFKAWSRKTIARLHPDALILGARGYNVVQVAPGSTLEATWSQGVASAVRTLSALAPQVAVLGDIPSHPDGFLDCLSNPGATALDCVSDDDSAETRSNPITRAAITGSKAKWVDMTPLVCSDGECPLVVGDRILYYNLDHVTNTWSRYVAPAVGALLSGVLPGAQPSPTAASAAASTGAVTSRHRAAPAA